MGSVNSFFSSLAGFDDWAPTKQIDHISYYLLKHEKQGAVTVKQIQDIQTELDLQSYSRTAQYLSESSRARGGKYVKVKTGGYRLERRAFNQIDIDVGHEPARVAVSEQLMSVVEQVTNRKERSFLDEAVNCYRVQANRATIIMIWIVAIRHMQEFVLRHKLKEFNTAFAQNPEKKISNISSQDEFSVMSEDKFILLMKSANIISNDVRKLLVEKLGIRNSAAHPSAIEFSGHKATEFALDIIQNILLKY